MNTMKYRQPIFDRSTGKFVDWHYWGVGIEQAGEEANVGFLTYKMGVTDPKDSQKFIGLVDIFEQEIYEGDKVTHDDTSHKITRTVKYVAPEYVIEVTESNFYRIGEYFGLHSNNGKTLYKVTGNVIEAKTQPK